MLKVALKAETVRVLLAKKNLTQNWLAQKLGISTAYMSQMLNGKRYISPKMRERFQGYFNHLGFDDLFEVLKW
jgi:transcriptional regulator with XRE-family HTH domain